MLAELEQRLGLVGQHPLVDECELRNPVQRAKRGAGRHRICRVGRDEQRGPLPSPQRAFETCGNLDRKENLPGSQHAVELLGRSQPVRDPEVSRALDGGQDGTADVAGLLQQHRGRQIARRRIDRIAEQDELHDRNHHDHCKRNPVAAQLDELLHQHRPHAAPETGRADLVEQTHWKLSFERFISSMNTSSSEGSERVQTKRLSPR